MVAPARASWVVLSATCALGVLALGGLETVALLAVVVAAAGQLRGALRTAGQPPGQADDEATDEPATGAPILRVDLAARDRPR